MKNTIYFMLVLTIGIFHLLPQRALTQSSVKNGYIITIEGDSITGKLAMRPIFHNDTLLTVLRTPTADGQYPVSITIHNQEIPVGFSIRVVN